MPALNLDETITTNATSEFALGQISVVVILVEFNNLGHTVSKDEISVQFFQKLADYYRGASYGQVEITGDIFGWYKLEHSLSFYGKDGMMVDDTNNDGGIDSWVLLQDAVAVADPEVDFAKYSHLVVVHAGYGQESSGASNDIWSVAYWGGLWIRTQDSKSFYGGAIVPEGEAQGASPFGVYVHEFGHLIGLVDHYGQGGKKNWVGRWGLMDKGLWNGDPPGSSPAQPTAWDRIKLGWIPGSRIAQPNASMKMNITLSALEVVAETGSYHVIKIPITSTTYYLVEARFRIGSDAALPDEGVVIYSVDTSLRSSNGMLRVLDATPDTDTTDDAAYKPGQSFTDAKNKITVVVVSKLTLSYSVIVDRSGPAPDIAVERVYFEPGVVSANETVTLKADVANRGSQAASAYKIDCHVNGELYHTFSISLAVGASTTIAVDWQAKSGLNKIRFSLNRSGGYPDSNPGNDVLEADLVVGYSIIIEVPANVPVKVNGTDRYPDDSGKVRIGALEGELMLELPEAVLLSGDTRLSFSRWSDGEKTNLRQIYVTQDLSLAAEYSKQYLLSLDPGGGEVAGAGWYDEGSEATAQAVTPSKVIEGRSRLRFTQWMGDMNSTSSTLTLTMDRPKRLKAGWQTQYYLAINSPFGPVSGSGWYDEQATATFTLGSATAENAGVRASFLGWNGDYTGSDTSAALTMNGPKNVEAVWRVEYQLTVISDHGHPSGSGWYQTGSEATIRVEETVGEAEGVRLVFTGWSGDVTSSQAEATIKVEKPMTVKAAWKTQYKVKFSAVGLPQGATFNFTLNGQERPITAPFAESYWYDAGSTISFNATYRIPVKLGFYLLDHWEDQEGNKVLGPCEVDKPLTLSAIYKQGFGCIIATATYGSELSPQVSFLRTFRDTQVLSSFAGYCFMSVFNRWYYSFSPTVADQITLHESVKPIIRAALAPLLWILQASARVYALTPGDPEASVVVSGIVASALIGAVHLSPMLISSSLIFSRASRRLGRLYRKAAGSLALLAAASLAGVYVAELTRFYPMMELATASLVLSTIFLSASLTNRLFMKLSSTRLHKRAIRWMGLER